MGQRWAIRLVCRQAGATLPPPSKVLNDTWELIVDPFFDRGGLDKGLFWHLSASLQRVGLGYALASIVAKSELSDEYITPSMFDARVVPAVAAAVAEAAVKTGVARKQRR